jgi:hypothetical protein
MNNYFKVLVIAYMAYTSISCNQQDRFVKKLTNNKTQFWDVYDPKGGYITGSYSFDNGGKCFYYTNKNGERSKIYDGDVVYPHTWSHMGDSILNIHDFDRKVLHFTEDTLIILNTKTNDTTLLVSDKQLEGRGQKGDF